MSSKIEQRTFIGMRGVTPSRRSIFGLQRWNRTWVPATFRWTSIPQLFKCSEDNFFFRSGTSRMILMVTSPYRHRMLHPRGLVTNLLGLRFQFRGNWSGWIVSFTSESDSNTLADCAICHTLFSASLQTWISSIRINECLRPNQTRIIMLPGCVSIIILLLAVPQFSFVSS